MDADKNDKLSQMLDLIRSYRSGAIGLNATVTKLEQLNEVIDAGNWSHDIHELIFEIEQINAVALDQASITDTQRRLALDHLQKIENMAAGRLHLR